MDYSFQLGISAVLLAILIWKCGTCMILSKYLTCLVLMSPLFAIVAMKIPSGILFAPCSVLLCLHFMGFSNYVIIGIAVFLLVYVLLKYWKLKKIYEVFPTYPFMLYYIYCTICRKIPPNLPFAGFLFQNLVRLARKFQGEGMVLLWFPQPTLLIFSEEAVKIFSNEKAALNKTGMYNIVKEFFGGGLLTSNGETWKKHRKMLNPVFQVGALKHTMSIFNENAENLVKKLEEENSESPIDLLEYLKFCVGSIVFEYTMGFKVDSPEKKAIFDDIFHAVKVVGESFVYRFVHPWLHFKFMLNLTPSGRTYLKMEGYCRHFIKKVILEAKESANFSKISKNEGDLYHDDRNTNSLAHILLKHDLEDPDFNMEYIQDEVSTILAAGFDTLSYGLIWSLFLVGHHPDVQEKAFNEIHALSEGGIQYEDLHKFKYLECIIKEALRLYPPSPIYSRHIDKDVQCGKYTVPKGTDVAFFPFMLHRDPAVYPDPEKFNPDRFLEGKLENHPWAYIPFSEGIRNCIGKRFAMMEMKVILTHIIRNFQIKSVTPREEVDLCWIILLAPIRPLLFKLTPRK